MSERPIELPWKGSVPKGTEGSNPSDSSNKMPRYAILVKRLGREPSDMFEGSIPFLGTKLMEDDRRVNPVSFKLAIASLSN